jgi:hypothetical protein
MALHNDKSIGGNADRPWRASPLLDQLFRRILEVIAASDDPVMTKQSGLESRSRLTTEIDPPESSKPS